MADLTAMLQAAAGAGGDANFIEDVFSTFLWTNTVSSGQVINNGIDLTGEGGLVWVKSRSIEGTGELVDTVRGAGKTLFSAFADAQTNYSGVAAFSSTGFTYNSGFGGSPTFCSWTFRKQPKFFDVVTYTGNGANRTVAHGLGSVPGFIIVKRTDATADWQCFHRSLANTQYMVLNSTAAVATGATRWNSTTPTDAVFSLGTDATVNASGGTYVAYVYAHNAGGFGLSGEDNVISCSSFVGTGGISDVNLGYEPQWLLFKDASSGTADWQMFDTMRGFAVGNSSSQRLNANTAGAETNANFPKPTSTGFQHAIAGGNTCIYIAIRRGPMKVPETGTSVFAPNYFPSGGNFQVVNSGFPVDFQIGKDAEGVANIRLVDRLRGVSSTPQSPSPSSFGFLSSNTTDQEFTGNSLSLNWSNVGFTVPILYTGGKPIFWSFRRAPGFFDEVCYTATAGGTVNHNLTVVPELIINKSRNIIQSWTTAVTGLNNFGNLNRTDAFSNFGSNIFIPTATTFNSSNIASAGDTYVAYLFASCPGVSKVGSYTGTGTTQVINCGFTAGSRFIMIKRTDSTGNWYVWDSARGIVAGNDPYLLLNSTAAEVTNTDFVDTASVGFEISSTAPAEINASGGTFIFFAVS